MRILILADSNSPHTLRWAKSIRNNNNSIAIFSIHKPDPRLYEDTPDILLSSIGQEKKLNKLLRNLIPISFILTMHRAMD